MLVYKSVLSSGEGSGSGVPIDSFEITTLPSKLQYNVGETLDTTGMVVTATAGGMSGNVVSNCTISPTQFTEFGPKTIRVNYFTESETFNVLVIEEQIGTLEETSWNLIKTVGSAGLGEQYWSVGDTKSIIINGAVGAATFNNYETKVFIIGFNHNGDNGIYFQGFKNASGTDIALFNNTATTTDGTKNFNYNHWGNISYGGWKGCDMRYDILGSTNVPPSGYGEAVTSDRVGYDATSTCATNPVPNTLMAAFPSDLRAVIAPWTIYSDNIGVNRSISSHVSASIDYLPLISEFELDGKQKQANVGEQTYQAQFTFYKNGGYKYKAKSTITSQKCNWCLRSYYGGTSFLAMGIGTGGICSNAASKANGLAPAFRVA